MHCTRHRLPTSRLFVVLEQISRGRLTSNWSYKSYTRSHLGVVVKLDFGLVGAALRLGRCPGMLILLYLVRPALPSSSPAFTVGGCLQYLSSEHHPMRFREGSASSVYPSRLVLRTLRYVGTHLGWCCDKDLLMLLADTRAGSKSYYQYIKAEHPSLTCMSDNTHTLTRCE